MNQDKARRALQGPAGQSGRGRIRHVRRDRGGPGSGALVLPRRRRGGHDREGDVGLRHDLQRRDLRSERSLRRPAPAADHARSRISAADRAARRAARAAHQVLRLRQHGRDAQLLAQAGWPRLARHPLPDRPVAATVGHHHSRHAEGHRGRTAAGSARADGREPGLRRALHARRSAGDHSLAARQPDGRSASRWTWWTSRARRSSTWTTG